MPIEISLFGYPRVVRAGRALDIGLRKALALLAYLGVTGGFHSRDMLAELLWPDSPEGEGRARLRRTLYRLQKLLGDGVLLVTPDTVGLHGDAIGSVDVMRYRQCVERSREPTAEGDEERNLLVRACGLYTDDFLAGFALADNEAFEEWRFFLAEDLRQSLGHVLERLARLHATGGDHASAISCARRWVGLDRLHEPAHRLLIGLHLAAGELAAARQQFERCRSYLQSELDAAPQADTVRLMETIERGEPAAPHEEAGQVPPSPVAYVRSGDISIAYRVYGSGPVTLVAMPGFVSHLDVYWSQPELAGFMRALGNLARVICFDKRGMGLSDRVAYAPTIEYTVADLMAVLDAEGVDRAVLFGVSEGGPAAVACAAWYPERVSGLILYGTLARAMYADDYPWGFAADDFDTRVDRLIRDWGGPAFIELFAPSWANDPSRSAWWASSLRLAASPGAVRGVFQALKKMDVRGLLPQIACPTVVLHRSGEQAVVVEHGRYLAARIPDAQLIELCGQDHWWWIDGGALLQHMAAFLRSLPEP
ncbi:MAG: alpha/beta fold hydrolase [Ectothiorhodospiraceae bacterium]|nr:alpha/beta fold hydrolase [Ectothiorhodospiraceae bacterium]MCH8503494.1 alpha/beta fold hydrolase [Ectothiorhodospiraceae bacterium]